MNIIVFGSSGFIGSHLVEHLVKNGYVVDGCDVADGNGKLRNYFSDTNDPEAIAEIFKNNYDVCVNCAGAASVPLSFADPLKDYQLNTQIVFHILSAIKANNPKCKFINLSSAAVYGQAVELPIVEGQRSAPISPYGTHKRISELICDEFRTLFDIQACYLRIFSAYGPGLRKQLFWDMWEKATNSNTLELFGTGEETRDFIYATDLVRAIELVMNSDFSNAAINVGNGEEVSIKEASELFCAAHPNELSVQFTGKEKQGDPSRWVADVSTLKRLGYSPEVTMAEGIQQYVNWAQSVG